MIQYHYPEYQSLIEKVYQHSQDHVFKWWDDLAETSRKRLLDQLYTFDFDLMDDLKEKLLLSSEKKNENQSLKPPEIIGLPQTEEEKKREDEAREIGEQQITKGKVAAFLVAGGQGTRLGFNGPKGCYPMGPVTGKSLFHIHAEKIVAASQKYNVTIPWYLMTSSSNDNATKDFFNKENYFGLGEENVFFFQQRMIPALDAEGKLILDRKDHVFENPNGHGGSLLALSESIALNDMQIRGIEFISYYQVDNALVTIIDPVFIGYHVQANAEMSSKIVCKRDPHEKVGLLGLVNGRMKVIEYSDMSKKEKEERLPNGKLKYSAGSIAIHLINVDFVNKEVEDGFKLPYHMAYKKISFLNNIGEFIQPEKPNGFKFETFFFDALSDTTSSVVMEVARKNEFSPVKNKEGKDSPDTAKQDMSNYFGKWLEKAHFSIPRNSKGDVKGFIEISPLYAIDQEAFLEKEIQQFLFQETLYIGPESINQ